MKYKVINTSLLLNGKLIPEGSEIELSKEEIVGIEAYLQPIEVNHVPNLIREPLSNKTIKQLNNKKEKIK